MQRQNCYILLRIYGSHAHVHVYNVRAENAIFVFKHVFQIMYIIVNRCFIHIPASINGSFYYYRYLRIVKFYVKYMYLRIGVM